MTNIDRSLRSLDLASSRARKRLLLIPELVEAALARLGERQLSLEEQREVIKATATPDKVNWPAWWQAR